MQDIRLFGFTIAAWLYGPVFYLTWVSLLFVMKRILFAKVRKIAHRTALQLDDIFIDALEIPLNIMIFVSGATMLERIWPLGKNAELTSFLMAGFKAAAIVAVILFIDKLIVGAIRTYGGRIEALRASSGIFQGILRTVVFGLGLLILLDSFGVSITPLLASLGIGSLAVALALQPTLENFFSGVQIFIDKPVRIGQFVRLESGEEGYVHKVGWRSTWIRMLPNNVVVIPNKVLVNSKVLNYYYPSEDMAVLVQVGVHYESDLKHVERVTIEVGEEIMREIQGGVPEFKPFIRYHTFNDFSIDFTVILRCKEFVDNYLIKHEFIKKLHERYAKEGINIPYPIRALNYSQEKAERE